jgi:hypothetical protein
MIQDFHKVIRLNNKAVCILEKYGLHPPSEPIVGHLKHHLLCPGGFSKKGRDVRILPYGALLDDSMDFINMIPNPVNILLDMRDRPYTESSPFIKPAELALVPRAVSRNPEQQAVGLARRADRPQFKSLVYFIFFIYLPF